MIEHTAYLSLDLGRLSIKRREHQTTYILPSDIAVLMLHHPAIVITAQALEALSAARAMVILTDDHHMPSGLLLPWHGQPRQALRLAQQIEQKQTTIPLELWRQIVTARIGTQAINLRHLACKGALRLERLASRVEPGDPQNIEAQAAKHYWKHIFPNGVRRVKQGAQDTLNARLNYGYAVLRSLIARELSLAGLSPALGIGHKSSENAFNLADDFMEPYRFLVERQIFRNPNYEDMDTDARIHAVGFIKATVAFEDGNYRLPAAIRRTIGSYCATLDRRTEKLTLPVITCR